MNNERERKMKNLIQGLLELFENGDYDSQETVNELLNGGEKNHE